MRVATRKILRTLALFTSCLSLLSGYARAQESRPQTPEVEEPAEAAPDTTPIAADKKPNVVFILADNVGYGDLGSTAAESCAGLPHLGSMSLRSRECDLPSTWSSQAAHHHEQP